MKALFHGLHSEEIMQMVANIIVAFGAIFLLGAGIRLAFLDRGAATITVFLGIGFLFVVLLFLAKFKRFKGFGFEAKMWEEKQEEASSLVDSLKKELDRLRTPRDYLLKGRTDEITKKLTGFAGTEFDCAYARTSGEQANFWWLLQPALENAGWKQVPWRPVPLAKRAGLPTLSPRPWR